jgi:hypothetical protein
VAVELGDFHHGTVGVEDLTQLHAPGVYERI